MSTERPHLNIAARNLAQALVEEANELAEVVAVCRRCWGSRIDVRWMQPLDEPPRPCADCCCPDCGTHTGGGFCPPHQHADDMREEAAAKRRDDR